MQTRLPAPVPVSETVPVPPSFPEMPVDVVKRFPSLEGWEEDVTAWNRRFVQAVSQQNRTVGQVVAQTKTAGQNLRVEFGKFVVTVTDEIDTITTEQVAQARRIVTVSAMAGINTNIKVQGTPPGAPGLNDYWIDNSNILVPITYQWNGAAWVEVTTPIAFAGVATEQTARVTADGFLSGKYTLTVIAGNVVTGMNITSSSGGGVDVSSVIFRATDFQIYNGVSGKTMFEVSGATVNLAGVLTVSTSGKVFIGVGTYGNANTAWYVDTLGQFSLKDKLTWNGTLLTINGAITAAAGLIGGWTIAATTLSANNAILDSAGQLVLGTANDIVYLSATDATYRLWVGNVAAGTATFSVTKAGALYSISGLIGGFTIAANALSVNSGINLLTIASAATTPFIRFGTLGGSRSSYFDNSGLMIQSAASNTFAFAGGTIDGQMYVTDGGALGSGFGVNITGVNGLIKLYNGAGTPTLLLSSTGGVTVTDGTVNAAVTVDSGTSRMTVGTSTNHSLQFLTNATLRWLIGTDGHLKTNGGDIRKLSSDGWTPILFDGAAQLELQASAGQVFARINGGAPILLG